MNTKKIQIIDEILTEQMNHWLLYPLALAFWGAIKELDGTALNPRLFPWFLCSLFSLTFFLLRCRIKRLFPFLILHLMTGALPFLLPLEFSGTKGVCIVCGLGYMMYSVVLRLKHNTIYTDALHLPVGIGISAISILFLHYLEIREWDNYYIFSLIGGIVLFLITSYIERYLYFLATNESSAGVLPAAEMFHSGMGLVVAYSLLGALVLAISAQVEWLYGILRPIKDLLIRFLRFLVFLFPTSEPAEELPLVEEQPINNMEAMELPEAGEPFWLWKVLEFLVLTLFACAFLFALGVLLWKLIQLIRKYMTLHSADKSNEEFGDAFDVWEKCDVEKEWEKRWINPFRPLSPREQIRKLYRKKLLSSMKTNVSQEKGLLELHTAREWEQKIGTDGMAALYEQARYSPHEVTKEDVRKMRKSCKT